MIKQATIIMLLLTALVGVCHAYSEDVFNTQYNALKLINLERSIPDSAKSQNPDLHISRNTSIESGLLTIGDKIRFQFKGIFSKGIKCVVSVIAIAALCAIAASIGESSGGSAVISCVSAVGAVALTAAAAGSVTSVIAMGGAAIADINAFSKVLLPSLAAACAATGMPTSAAARYAISVLFIDIVITLISSVLMPLVYAHIAASTADAAVENHSLSKICSFIRWIVTGSLKIIMMVFVGYITFSGIASATVDIVGVKTARFALSGAVPVVGSVIADAAETVIAGALVMKNSIGIFGMLVILSVCVTPFLTIAVNYVLFKGAAAVSAPICSEKMTRLIDNIGNSFGIVLGMTGSCVLLMFLSILLSMMTLGAV